jgi:predicted site-specific integrase-resolvase
MATTHDLVTSAATCERLGNIDRSTLTRWVAAGRIKPAMKLPGLRGAYLFEPAEVQRVQDELAAHETSPTAAAAP